MTLTLALTLAQACGDPKKEPSPLPFPAGLSPDLRPFWGLEPVARPRPDRVLSPRSRRRLQMLDPKATIHVTADLSGRPPWREIHARLEGAAPDLRRRAVLTSLAFVAARQEPVRDGIVEALRSEGLLHGDPEWFLALNRLHLRTNREGVRRLQAQEEIIRIRVAPPVGGSAPREDVDPPSSLAPSPTAWGPGGVGAQDLWGRGIRGQGVTVALLDGGWSPDHAALAPGYKPTPSCSPARRPGNHGTAVLSLAVGRALLQENGPLGVAPEARWIAADPFPEGGWSPVIFGRCVDWVVREGADVVILPWLAAAPPGEEVFEEAFTAWRTAGILVLVAAGNEGPAPRSNHPPANASGLLPGDVPVLSVGAIQEDGSLYPFSSRGPNRRTGGLFPLLVAPGTALLAAGDPPEATTAVHGTSFAVGVAGGAAALLRQAFPREDVPRLESWLETTSRDRGEPGPDFGYGHGLLDVAAAWRKGRTAREEPRRAPSGPGIE